MGERLEREPGMTDAEYGDLSDVFGRIYLPRERGKARRRASDLDRRQRRAKNASARPQRDQWRVAKLGELTDREQREWLTRGAKLIEGSWLTAQDRDWREKIRERRLASRRYAENDGRRKFPPEWKKLRCEACGSRDKLRQDYLSGIKSDNSWWNHLTICLSCQKDKATMRRKFGKYDGLLRWARSLDLVVAETWTAGWWKARIDYYD